MITINKTLCPVDFFPASDAAVNYAAGLAANYESVVRLLHVLSPMPAGAYEYAIDMTEVMKSTEETARRELGALASTLNDTGVAVETELRIGDVYDEIKRAIEVNKPDLIVMGTHGRRGVERWFMGSTTEKLLRHSPVPLITISASGEKTVTPKFKRI